MKNIKYLIIMAALAVCGRAQAQWNYVVDVIGGGDSTAVCKIVKTTSEVNPYKLGDTIMWLHNGDSVFVADADTQLTSISIAKGYNDRSINKSFATVTINGNKYFVKWADMKFCDNNRPMTEYIKINRKRDAHNPIGHFYMDSGLPYWLIFGLILLSFLCLRIGPRTGYEWYLYVVPILMGGGIALELIGVVTRWSDMLWWIDPKLYPLGKVFLHIAFFLATLVMQVLSMGHYREELEISGSNNPADGRLVPWWPLFSILIGVVVYFAIEIIWKSIDSDWPFFACLGLVLVGWVISCIKNSKLTGAAKGILFTVFSIVWGIGLLTSAMLFIGGLITAIAAFLESSAGMIIVLFIASKLGLMPSGGGLPSFGTGAGNSGVAGLYLDKNGGHHRTQMDADATNRHIDANRNG